MPARCLIPVVSRVLVCGLFVLLTGCDPAALVIGPRPLPAAPGDRPADQRRNEPAPGADLAAMTAALGDLLLHIEGSTGNSDRNAFATSVTDIQLCAFGRFGTRDFTSFASEVGDFLSEHFATGTWSLASVGGAVVLRLNVEESTDSNASGVREFEIAVGGGQVAVDGRVVRTENVAADCAAAQREQP